MLRSPGARKRQAGKPAGGQGAGGGKKRAVQLCDSSRQLAAGAGQAAAQAAGPPATQQHTGLQSIGPAGSAAAPAAAGNSAPGQQQPQQASAAAAAAERQQQQAEAAEGAPVTSSAGPHSPPRHPPQLPPKLLPRPFSGKFFYSGRKRQGGVGGGEGSGSLGSSAARQQEVDAKIATFHWQQAAEKEHLAFLVRAKKTAERFAAAQAAGREPAPRPQPTYAVFPTQRQACNRADQEAGLEVFSDEFSQDGKRRFIATSRDTFWQRYEQRPRYHRHSYEIIRQGAPCHLYFDLEFHTADNTGLDGAAAVDAVVALVRDQLLHTFQLDLQDSWVLELDSSTGTKFSRHIIIRIPGAAFASNAHVGAFVVQLCAQARDRQEKDPRAALLIVNKGGEEALFVDRAVYSRNRAFRLYLSSKCGKEAVLDNTGRYGGAGLGRRDFFFASLVTAEVDPKTRLLLCFDQTEEDAAAGGRGAHSVSAAAAAQLRGVLRSALPAASQVCYGPSPYPDLEAFINSVCCEGGVAGRVRSWVQLGDIMLFNIRDNRFCGNVGRAHKSNGIFLVVDLKEGSWHQRCYDPECRGYRSPLMPLPPHLLGLWQPAADPEAPLQGAPSQQQEQQQPGNLTAWGSGMSRLSSCGSCGGSSSAQDGGSQCCCGGGSGDGSGPAAARGEQLEDSLMVQALEQFESRRQQGQQQQAPEQQGQRMAAAAAAAEQLPAAVGGASQRLASTAAAGRAAGQTGAAAVAGDVASPGAEAAGAPSGAADDDDVMLAALLDFEQRGGTAAPPANQEAWPAGRQQQALPQQQAPHASQSREQLLPSLQQQPAMPAQQQQQPMKPLPEAPELPQQRAARGQQQQGPQQQWLEVWEKFQELQHLPHPQPVHYQ